MCNSCRVSDLMAFSPSPRRMIPSGWQHSTADLFIFLCPLLSNLILDSYRQRREGRRGNWHQNPPRDVADVADVADGGHGARLGCCTDRQKSYKLSSWNRRSHVQVLKKTVQTRQDPNSIHQWISRHCDDESRRHGPAPVTGHSWFAAQIRTPMIL